MDPPKKLKFYIGTCGNAYPSMNAKYFDIRLRTDEFAFKKDQAMIKKYHALSVQIPPIMKPVYAAVDLQQCS